MRQALGPGALEKPRGSRWRGRWEGGLGWGTHVNPWLFHSNVWQNSLQIKKKKKKENQKKKENVSFSCQGPRMEGSTLTGPGVHVPVWGTCLWLRIICYMQISGHLSYLPVSGDLAHKYAFLASAQMIRCTLKSENKWMECVMSARISAMGKHMLEWGGCKAPSIWTGKLVGMALTKDL